MSRNLMSIIKAGIQWVWVPTAYILLVGIVTLLGNLGPASVQRAVVVMLVNIVVVVGLYMFIGNTGILSFGHAGFMAVGAYLTGILVTPQALKQVLAPDLPSFLGGVTLSPVVGVLVGGAAAAVVALALAVPFSRLNGLTAGLATFAFLIITNVVAGHWMQITNGARGMAGIPITVTTSGAFAAACGAIGFAYVFQRSDLGLRVRVSREDDIAASALGISVAWHRGIAFVCSAFCVGIGGGLFAELNGSIYPDSFYLTVTFIMIAMLVVGGTRSLAGAVLGTVFISAVAEVLRQVEQAGGLGPLPLPSRPGTANVALAAILLVVLIVRPRGLTNGRELRLPRRCTRLAALRVRR